MTKGNDMDVTKEELAEIKKLKNDIGTLVNGQNGAFLMCALTSVIGDAGAQWSGEQSKRSFIADTVEAISQWYDYYLKEYEKGGQDE